MSDDLHALRFPIGEYRKPQPWDDDARAQAIDDIERCPQRVRAAIDGLSEEQLDSAYRQGGWTLRQVVHHLPDSHMNSYVRCKLALTEDHPTIRVYDEASWAELEDGATAPTELSLALLDSVHARWLRVLRSLTPAELRRPFRHPDIGDLTVDDLIAIYAWHSNHHIAHITSLRERMDW